MFCWLPTVARRLYRTRKDGANPSNGRLRLVPLLLSRRGTRLLGTGRSLLSRQAPCSSGFPRVLRLRGELMCGSAPALLPLQCSGYGGVGDGKVLISLLATPLLAFAAPGIIQKFRQSSLAAFSVIGTLPPRMAERLCRGISVRLAQRNLCGTTGPQRSSPATRRGHFATEAHAPWGRTARNSLPMETIASTHCPHRMLFKSLDFIQTADVIVAGPMGRAWT